MVFRARELLFATDCLQLFICQTVKRFYVLPHDAVHSAEYAYMRCWEMAKHNHQTVFTFR